VNNDIKTGYFCLAVVLGIVSIAMTQSVIVGFVGFFLGYAIAFLNEIRKARESGEF